MLDEKVHGEITKRNGIWFLEYPEIIFRDKQMGLNGKGETFDRKRIIHDSDVIFIGNNSTAELSFFRSEDSWDPPPWNTWSHSELMKEMSVFG